MYVHTWHTQFYCYGKSISHIMATRQWSEVEEDLLRQVRERLKAKLADRPQYPEVVGDRKLLRFLRGHDYDVSKACEMIEGFLDWRK